MSHGNKYHLQTTNDLQTLLLPPVQNDAFTQCVLCSPLYGDMRWDAARSQNQTE